MKISVGDTLPNATFLRMGPNGPETVDLHERLKGRKVVIFAVPGPFSTTCDTAHVPSFIRTLPGFKEKGVDEVICLAVSDVFIMKAWGESTGAEKAGISMLVDADASFTKAIGMSFDAPPVGFYGRSLRYSMLVEDGVVTRFNEETARGTCEISGGEALLAEL